MLGSVRLVFPNSNNNKNRKSPFSNFRSISKLRFRIVNNLSEMGNGAKLFCFEDKVKIGQRKKNQELFGL